MPGIADLFEKNCAHFIHSFQSSYFIKVHPSGEEWDIAVVVVVMIVNDDDGDDDDDAADDKWTFSWQRPFNSFRPTAVSLWPHFIPS